MTIKNFIYIYYVLYIHNKLLFSKERSNDKNLRSYINAKIYLLLTTCKKSQTFRPWFLDFLNANLNSLNYKQ